MKTATMCAALALALCGLAAAEERKAAGDDPKSDQDFVTWAIATDTAEIKMGEAAQKMSGNAAVQRFGQKMVTDHTNNRATLVAVGKVLKLDVAETMPNEHKDMLEKLSKLDKKDFDREYVKAQVEGHEKALKTYEKWAKDARDENLRNLATKAVPVVRGHLEEAQRLSREVGGAPKDKDK